MGNGTYNITQSTPIPTFTPNEILLYNLQITASNNWSCQYIGGSGSYTGYTITQFITELTNSTLGPPNNGGLPQFGTGESPPDIIVRMACWVVVVLTSGDASQLWFQSDPIKTINDCSSDYYQLTVTSFGSGNPTILYFAVPLIHDGENDEYTLYLTVNSGTGPTPSSIDPSIRNHGIHPPKRPGHK